MKYNNSQSLLNSKFSKIITENIITEIEPMSHCLEPIIYNPPVFHYDGIMYYRGSKEKVNIYLHGTIEEVIFSEECSALVLRESIKQQLIQVVYEGSWFGISYLVIWQPTFIEIFNELINDESSPDAKIRHYNIMNEICNELEYSKQIDIEPVVQKHSFNPNIEWTVKLEDYMYSSAVLYHSILKEIMISEDKKYNKSYHKGRYKIIEAYDDLAIKGMSYNDFLLKYKL